MPTTPTTAAPTTSSAIAEGAEAREAIDAVWRRESARLVAAVARIVRDVGLAEELAQAALVAALERWPETGIPENPGAWLMAVAKHRAIDLLRRRKLAERKHEELGHEIEADRDDAVPAIDAALEQWPESGVPRNPGAWLMATAKHRAIDRLRRAKLIERKHQELGHELETTGEGETPDLDAALDEDIGDDLLRLMFTACHPVLSTEAQVALTLRLLGSLTTEEIARAFLVPEPTIAQRIVRAKRTLAEKRVPFEVPRGADRAERLASVLGVLYLVFNEGYTATAGGDWIRPQLCEEALRLGRVLAGLAPEEPEVHGLVALMEIQASRRTNPRYTAWSR